MACETEPQKKADIVAVQNEKVVFVSDSNYKKPLRKAKHQQDILKDYFNHLDALAGQGGRIWNVSTWAVNGYLSLD